MIPLKNVYIIKGFEHKLIKRINDWAIFSQVKRNKIIAYEVVKIVKYNDINMFDKLILAHETLPGNEKWGADGFTCFTIEEA
jgi:hypothetical protein